MVPSCPLLGGSTAVEFTRSYDIFDLMTLIFREHTHTHTLGVCSIQSTHTFYHDGGSIEGIY